MNTKKTTNIKRVNTQTIISMKKEEYIMVCPKCGSIDIEHDYSQPALVAGGIFSYKCNNCSHVAVAFPEIHIADLHKPKNPKKIKNKELVDIEVGKGLYKLLQYIAPLGVLFNALLMVNQRFLYFGAFGILYYLAISLIASDDELHRHPVKQKILGIFIAFGVIMFFFLYPY